LGEWAYYRNKLSVIVMPLEGGITVKYAGNALSILGKLAGESLVCRGANMPAAAR
jgi:hypothetical protein